MLQAKVCTRAWEAVAQAADMAAPTIRTKLPSMPAMEVAPKQASLILAQRHIVQDPMMRASPR